MTNKATKYGLMTISAVLLVAMAFAGAASADGNVARIIGGDEYATLEDAVSAAQSGDTIELMQDYSLTSSITLKDSYTLCIPTGKTLTLMNCGIVVAGNSVLINGGGTIKKGTAAGVMIGDDWANKDYSWTIDGITLDGGAVWTGAEDPVLHRGTVNTGIKVTSGNQPMLLGRGATISLKNAILQNFDSTQQKSTVLNSANVALYIENTTVRNITCTDCDKAIFYNRGGMTLDVKSSSFYGNYAVGSIFGDGGVNEGKTVNTYAIHDGCKFYWNDNQEGWYYAIVLYQRRANDIVTVEGGEFYENGNSALFTVHNNPTDVGLFTGGIFHDNPGQLVDGLGVPVFISGNPQLNNTYSGQFTSSPYGGFNVVGPLSAGANITITSDRLTQKIAEGSGYAITASDMGYFYTNGEGYNFCLNEEKNKIYAVKLELNGGTLTDENMTKFLTDGKAIFPNAEKSGFNSCIWYTTSTFDPGTEVGFVEKSGIYYANYTQVEKTYVLSYETNDLGTPSVLNKEYVVGSTYGDLPTVACATGYKWNQNWYADSSFSSAPIQTTDIITTESHHKIYAKIDPISYTVSFIKNDDNATGSMNSMVLTYDEPQNLDTNTFVLCGHNFAGWATTADGSVAYGDGESVINLASTENANVPLYAKWTVKPNFVVKTVDSTQNVTFDTDGVVSSSVNLTTISGLPVNSIVAFSNSSSQADPSADSGYTLKHIYGKFEIEASSTSSAEIVFNVTLLPGDSKENIVFKHYSSGVWTTLSIISTDVHEDGVITYVVETSGFSPFAIISETATSVYTPSSSSKHSGSTVILSEGQVAPTAYATVAPTVAPTVKPTEKPATPTVIATEKPTTQATQQSPAPFVGLLAGLGAAAVLLRMRK